MEHFITEVRIDKVRHLRNISIKLDGDKRQHLILTGKNGSGKTSLLEKIRMTLSLLNRTSLDSNTYENYDKHSIVGGNIGSNMGVTIFFNQKGLPAVYVSGDFITASFSAVRPTNDIAEPKGVKEIRLKKAYTITDDPAKDIWKYMVHLKTQQLYAKDANDTQTEQNIEAWFNRFEDSLKILMDDASVRLKYEYKKYSFEIQQNNQTTEVL